VSSLYTSLRASVVDSPKPPTPSGALDVNALSAASSVFDMAQFNNFIFDLTFAGLSSESLPDIRKLSHHILSLHTSSEASHLFEANEGSGKSSASSPTFDQGISLGSTLMLTSTQWTAFLAIAGALEEHQFHIVEAVWPRVRSLYSLPAQHLRWLQLLVDRGTHHANASVRQYVVCFIIDQPAACVCPVNDAILQTLLHSLNACELYRDAKRFGYLLSIPGSAVPAETASLSAPEAAAMQVEPANRLFGQRVLDFFLGYFASLSPTPDGQDASALSPRVLALRSFISMVRQVTTSASALYYQLITLSALPSFVTQNGRSPLQQQSLQDLRAVCQLMVLPATAEYKRPMERAVALLVASQVDWSDEAVSFLQVGLVLSSLSDSILLQEDIRSQLQRCFEDGSSRWLMRELPSAFQLIFPTANAASSSNMSSSVSASPVPTTVSDINPSDSTIQCVTLLAALSRSPKDTDITDPSFGPALCAQSTFLQLLCGKLMGVYSRPYMPEQHRSSALALLTASLLRYTQPLPSNVLATTYAGSFQRIHLRSFANALHASGAANEVCSYLEVYVKSTELDETDLWKLNLLLPAWFQCFGPQSLHPVSSVVSLHQTQFDTAMSRIAKPVSSSAVLTARQQHSAMTVMESLVCAMKFTHTVESIEATVSLLQYLQAATPPKGLPASPYLTLKWSCIEHILSCVLLELTGGNAVPQLPLQLLKQLLEDITAALDAVYRDSAALMLRSASLLISLVSYGPRSLSVYPTEASSSSSENESSSQIRTASGAVLDLPLIKCLLETAYTLFSDNLKWDVDSSNTRAFLSLLFSPLFLSTTHPFFHSHPRDEPSLAEPYKKPPHKSKGKANTSEIGDPVFPFSLLSSTTGGTGVIRLHLRSLLKIGAVNFRLCFNVATAFVAALQRAPCEVALLYVSEIAALTHFYNSDPQHGQSMAVSLTSQDYIHMVRKMDEVVESPVPVLLHRPPSPLLYNETAIRTAALLYLQHLSTNIKSNGEQTAYFLDRCRLFAAVFNRLLQIDSAPAFSAESSVGLGSPASIQQRVYLWQALCILVPCLSSLHPSVQAPLLHTVNASVWPLVNKQVASHIRHFAEIFAVNIVLQFPQLVDSALLPLVTQPAALRVTVAGSVVLIAGLSLLKLHERADCRAQYPVTLQRFLTAFAAYVGAC
jgi:hypothetical protein